MGTTRLVKAMAIIAMFAGITGAQSDINDQMRALVKTGDAYFNIQSFSEAESKYNAAIQIYERHRGKSNIDPANVAQAYFKIGEIHYKKFENITLTAKNENEMADVVKQKIKALEEPAKYFAKVIELGADEWTMRAYYMIGKGFYDMAEAVAGQPLFGNEIEQLGGKIKILSSLDKYYDKAMDYFKQNIIRAKKRNLKGEYIELSKQTIMEIAYKKGANLEKAGLLLKYAPMPKELAKEDTSTFRRELEAKYLKSQDAAVPMYENGMKLAMTLGIVESPWIDRIRKRLSELNPASQWIDVQIVEQGVEQEFEQVIEREIEREEKQSKNLGQLNSSSREAKTPQKRREAAGLRLGIGPVYSLDADYRGAVGKSNGVEISFSYNFIADDGDEFSNPGAYELFGAFEWRGFITKNGGLSWYVGPCLNLGIYESRYGSIFGIGFGGQIGIELDFSAFTMADNKNGNGLDDLEYTLDIRPIYMSGGRGLICSIGFGFRYTF
jgi:tetratricopeptide (TPR) repeat protein